MKQNKENLCSIAIYNKSGSLMEAEPVVAQKEDPNVTKQEWFMACDESDGKYSFFHTACTEFI